MGVHGCAYHIHRVGNKDATMSKKQEFDNLSQQYSNGVIHWDEFAYPVGQIIEELEQRINDVPRFYYKHSFIKSEQSLLIQEMSSETSEAVRSFRISHGTTLKDTNRALRIAGMDSDSSELFIHQGLTATMSERGIHIVVDLQDIVRAVYKV